MLALFLLLTQVIIATQTLSVEQLIRQGQAEFVRKNYIRSVVLLRKARALDPGLSELDYLIGVNYMRLKQPERALPFLLQAREHTSVSNETAIHRQIILAYLAISEEKEAQFFFDEALQALAKALEISDPASVMRLTQRRHQILFAKASYHFGLNQHLEAALTYSTLALEKPDEQLMKRTRRVGVKLFDEAIRYCDNNEYFDHANLIRQGRALLFSYTSSAVSAIVTSSEIPEWLISPDSDIVVE